MSAISISHSSSDIGERRLAVDGGAAVVELYRTIGIIPEEQPDGSLYVHVVDPAVAPLPDS